MSAKPNRGVELWEKAKKIIPGGTQLVSKRAERFLPGQWPSYYTKAKGIQIWDLEGKQYTDMTIMGIGACVLGYADPDVNKAVSEVVEKGNMATLNPPEDVDLAEKLLQLNPWAGMVRYTRTAGEALAVAVRIARAYTKKDKIALCGYHGWHDWYLAANLGNDKSLDGHLLPGLEPLGVPRALTGTTLTFEYDKPEQLEALVKQHKDIGVIILEPMRHHYPKDNFLQKVRKIADEAGAVLIFDETTSGWRMNVGGVYSLLGVNPDMVVYGKAMSNGFPMAAVVGKGEVMETAWNCFISSTFWTDRVGPVAALATIHKLERHKVPEHLKSIGTRIGKGWQKLAQESGLQIEVEFDFPPLIEFELKYGDKSQALTTLFTQEMLARDYLAARSVYVSYSHQNEDVDRYLEAAAPVFSLLKKAADEGTVEKMLKGPVASGTFKRLTR